jgi:predicted nucleic acid-binding Zn ribbon protein
MRDIPRSPRIEELRRKRQKRNLGLAFLLLLTLFLILIGLSLLSRIRGFSINQIEINGNNVIKKNEIETLVSKHLEGKYIYLFPKSNSLIYPRVKIYNDLIYSFPRIEDLFVYVEKFKTLKIDITERAGSYLYCGKEIPEEESEVGENCYFIDQDGYIFDKAPYFSGNIYFKYFMGLLDNPEDPSGQEIMAEQSFRNLVNFIKGISKLGFQSTHIFVDTEGISHLYLKEGQKGLQPEIVFRDQENLDSVLEDFSLAMKKQEFADEIISKYDDLLYIDLRFKNKVFYKFKD